MSDKNVDCINYLMLTNPTLNPFGWSQHAINPIMQPNVLDNPLLTNGLLVKQPKEDNFVKQDANVSKDANKKTDINFKGASENVGACYPQEGASVKKRNASILSLMGFGTVVSSLGAYKFSEIGKKHPSILTACMVVGTIGGLLGLLEMSKANKDLSKTNDILNTKV